MKRKTSRKQTRHEARAKAYAPIVLAAALTTVFVAGCAQIRKVTYPPTFTYIERSELRSTMGDFASRLWDINEILSRKNVTEEDRQRVAELLQEMEERADKLNPKGNPTNHPAIDVHLEDFRAELWEARSALEDDPPNYFLAGQLYGKCLGCHKERDSLR